jgi:hypothetical protein
MQVGVEEKTTEKAATLRANSWQARLDKALLSLDTEPAVRFRLLQRAFGDPALQEDVRSAVDVIQQKGFGEGHPEVIEKLWPTGTTARADLEGLTALRKQVPELLEDLQKQAQDSPPSLFSLPGDNSAGPSLPDPTTVFNSLVTLATDPKKQEALKEEALDSFRSTPKGLETPQYKVVAKLDGPISLGKPEPIEVRAYEEFTVAKTSMETSGFGSSSGAKGFNTLASYLFGKNEANQEMAMTMPVEISMATGGSEGAMSFVLPKSYADAPPAPLTGADVTIDTVPERLVAAKAFAGIVTDQEVERQKNSLLDALAADGSFEPTDVSQVSVLQYNSPFTIPWRRRNEVVVVVTQKEVTGEQEEEKTTEEGEPMETVAEKESEQEETKQEPLEVDEPMETVAAKEAEQGETEQGETVEEAETMDTVEKDEQEQQATVGEDEPMDTVAKE